MCDNINLEEIRSNWDLSNLKEFRSDERAENGKPVMIRYREFPAENPKAAIVISSGRTECMFKYDETIYELNKDDFSVFIHDHRGQGLSDTATGEPKDADGHGPGHVESFDHYVEDLHKFVKNYVLPSVGEESRLLLLGHSMGGCIATLYIEKYPLVFAAAALCSPMHEPDLGILPPFAVEGLAKLRALKGNTTDYAGKGGPYRSEEFNPITAKKEALTHSKLRYERIRAMFDEQVNARVGSATYGWVELAIDAAEKAIDYSQDIQIPVLLLQASEDVAVTSAGQNAFRDKLNSKYPDRCTLLSIEGAYHELLIESDEYRTLAISSLRAFFNSNM